MKRKMKKQKFKNRNGRKLHKTTPGRKSGRLLFEYITLGGILLSAAVLLISLSAYFLPRIPEPEKEIMDAVPPALPGRESRDGQPGGNRRCTHNRSRSGSNGTGIHSLSGVLQ